jgi:acyl carrier protein
MTDDLLRRVRSVVAATFGVPEAAITEATSNATLDRWDSMNHIHLIVALEGEFGVSFEPERAIELTSIREIAQALLALGAK